MRRPLAAVGAAALTALLLGTAAAGPAQAGPRQTAAAASCVAVLHGRTPVLLVHGFTSSASSAWPSAGPMQTALRRIPGAQVDTFDYSSVNDHRVTDPLIGPALAARIRCLSDASRATGGTGKVAVVAHSLGGLATRCALSVSCSGVAGVASRVGLVVTLGTPHLGSFLRGDSVSSAAENALGDALSLNCTVANVRLLGTLSGLCKIVREFGTSQAATAFTPGSKEQLALPPFPTQVPVLALAGQAHVTDTMFGHTFTLNGDVGDLVVGTSSALAEHTSSSPGGHLTVDCGNFDVALFAFKAGRPSCWHSSETNNDSFVTQTLVAVGKMTRAQQPHPTVAWAAPAGATYGVLTLNRAGRDLSVPGALDDKASSPVGWLDHVGNRLLLWWAAPGSPVRTYSVLSIDLQTLTGAASAAELGVAADDLAVIGGLRDSSNVARYSSTLTPISTSAITGLPPSPSAQHDSIHLLGVRKQGIVVARPSPEGTAAYGGPEQIYTVDWAGHAKLVTQDDGNVAIAAASLSPDGAQLLYDGGSRTGMDGNYHTPVLVDLSAGKSRTAPMPPALKEGNEVYVNLLHFAADGTPTWSWMNSGGNGEWDDPVPGNVQVPPSVYRWSPNKAPVPVADRALFYEHVSDGSNWRVAWTPDTFATGSTSSTDVFYNGRNLGPIGLYDGPPVGLVISH